MTLRLQCGDGKRAAPCLGLLLAGVLCARGIQAAVFMPSLAADWRLVMRDFLEFARASALGSARRRGYLNSLHLI